MSPHELRAEKPDDVLFAGSPGHAPADFCEVELLFDNEDGALPELDFSEVSVMRRLHRGGEGQYLINRAAVRRTDLVELLADVGLGGSHGSVISQGRGGGNLPGKPGGGGGGGEGGGGGGGGEGGGPPPRRPRGPPPRGGGPAGGVPGGGGGG